jgi:hypothetical protein
MGRLSMVAACLFVSVSAPAFAQTYTDLASYCQDVSEVSTTTPVGAEPTFILASSLALGSSRR